MDDKLDNSLNNISCDKSIVPSTSSSSQLIMEMLSKHSFDKKLLLGNECCRALSSSVVNDRGKSIGIVDYDYSSSMIKDLNLQVEIRKLDLKPTDVVVLKSNTLIADSTILKMIAEELARVGVKNPILITHDLDPKSWDLTQLMLYRNMIDITIEQIKELQTKEEKNE